MLRRLLREADRTHAPCGNQVVAGHAEEARRAWMARRLVAYGRARANALGWTDVYTFTKALAERATEEGWAGRPLTVLRPAIVESALRHPYPGWIDGHKMLDPLIIDYGTGAMWDLPGDLDIIPADLVVNAILAAAAAVPPADAPHYFHVGSGAGNPLTYAGRSTTTWTRTSPGVRCPTRPGAATCGTPGGGSRARRACGRRSTSPTGPSRRPAARWSGCPVASGSRSGSAGCATEGANSPASVTTSRCISRTPARRAAMTNGS